MNKFILGGILAAISLLAVYGTRASDRVTSWVDGSNRSSAQANAGQAQSTGQNAENPSFVALNSADAEADRDSTADVSNQTPLEKAGDIPQRQTVGSTPNFGTSPTTTDGGDDTGGGVVQPNPSTPTPTDGAAGNTTSTPSPAPSPAPTEAPIRALW